MKLQVSVRFVING